MSENTRLEEWIQAGKLLATDLVVLREPIAKTFRDEALDGRWVEPEDGKRLLRVAGQIFLMGDKI